MDNPHITITPGVGWGKPCIRGTAIQTAVIADRIAAGETTEDVAKDYGISVEAVEAAVEFEGRQE